MTSKSSTSQKTAKSTSSSKSQGGRAAKRADEGLSAKERIFVHALRALFDPKGDTGELKAVRKDFVSPKGSEKKPKPKGAERAPRKLHLRGDSQKPLYKMAKENSELYAERHRTVVEKPTKYNLHKFVGSSGKGTRFSKGNRKSPSKVKRAEKRKTMQKKSNVYVIDIPILDVSLSHMAFEATLPGESRSGKRARLVKKLEKERVEERRKTLAAVSLKRDQQELEVVTAWGGAPALSMLQKYTPHQVSAVSWKPFVTDGFLAKKSIKHFSVSSNGKTEVVGSIKRDYTKAVLGITALTKKRQVFLNTAVGSGVTRKGSRNESLKPRQVKKTKEEKPKVDLKQSKGKTTTSRARRSEMRAEKFKSLKIESTSGTKSSKSSQKVVAEMQSVEEIYASIASLKSEEAMALFAKISTPLIRSDKRAGEELLMYTYIDKDGSKWKQALAES